MDIYIYIYGRRKKVIEEERIRAQFLLNIIFWQERVYIDVLTTKFVVIIS